jgi:hypothetical protein
MVGKGQAGVSPRTERTAAARICRAFPTLARVEGEVPL